MCRCRNVNEFFSLGSQIWFTVYRIFVLSLVRFPNWKTLISDKVIRFLLFNRSSSIKFEMMFATIKSNYKKLLVIALTSSRTSSYIKHDFFTISLHSSCKCCCFSCFEASSNENSMGKKPLALKLLVLLPFELTKYAGKNPLSKIFMRRFLKADIVDRKKTFWTKEDGLDFCYNLS